MITGHWTHVRNILMGEWTLCERMHATLSRMGKCTCYHHKIYLDSTTVNCITYNLNPHIVTLTCFILWMFYLVHVNGP